MDSDLQQRIQDHYEDPYHHGRCEYATHYAELATECVDSAKDVIAVELRIAQDEIREIWFEGNGCDLSQAFTSMLAEKLENKRTDAVRELSFEEALQQVNVAVDVDRQSCCKLALDAIQNAINSQGLETEDTPNFGGPDLGDEC